MDTPVTGRNVLHRDVCEPSPECPVRIHPEQKLKKDLQKTCRRGRLRVRVIVTGKAMPGRYGAVLKKTPENRASPNEGAGYDLWIVTGTF